MLEPRVSVVIPTLNEESALRQRLASVIACADQVVVSDGDSTDQTVAFAQSLGAETVSAQLGRGNQLNSGADKANGDILLFLHADTDLPEGALKAIRQACSEGAEGGGFLIRFDSDSPVMRFGTRMVNRRTRSRRLPLGDQAQFVLRSVFLEMEGFREWPILEDFDFIRRLRKRGHVAVVPLQVTTSSRRFLERGPARTVALNWLIWALYFLGISPQRLARLYRPIR